MISRRPPEEGLFVSDVELYSRLGVGPRTGRIAVRSAQRGFPPKDPLFGNKRYWPAVRVSRRSLYSWPDQLEMRRPSARQTWVVGQFDCGKMTGLNGSAGGAYLKNEPRFVCAIDPRRIRLVAGLR